jgi:hypothetical protein
MIRFEPGPEACNGYFQISWTPSKIDSKQQLIHACISIRQSVVDWIADRKICKENGFESPRIFLLWCSFWSFFIVSNISGTKLLEHQQCWKVMGSKLDTSFAEFFLVVLIISFFFLPSTKKVSPPHLHKWIKHNETKLIITKQRIQFFSNFHGHFSRGGKSQKSQRKLRIKCTRLISFPPFEIERKKIYKKNA